MKSSFEKMLERCRERLEAAKKHADELGLGGAFEAVLAESERTEFRVSVLGRFKQGKSSVLNALIANDLLPTDALPCTSTLIEIRRGERFVFSEVDGSKRVRRSRKDFLAAVGGAAAKPSDGALRWEVQVPSEAVSPGMVFVDTPGTDEDATRHAMALEELRRTDAALFVLGARQPAGADELDDLRELQERVPIVLVLVNQMDRIPVADRARLLMFIRNRMESAGVPSERVLPFSALGAIQAEPDALRLLDDVRVTLSDVLLRNTAGLRLGALQGTIAQLVGRLEPQIDEAVAARVGAHADEERSLKEAAQALSALEETLSTIDRACREHGRTAASGTRRAMKAAWPGVLDWLGSRRARWKSNTNPLLSPRGFAEDIANAARTDLLRDVARVTACEIQPLIEAELDALHAEIDPHLRSMLATIERVAPSKRSRRKRNEELFADVMRSVVESAAQSAERSAAEDAVGASINALITQMIVLIVSSVVAGVLVPPVLIAVALTGVVMALFKGREWVEAQVRDKIATVMVEKLAAPEATTRDRSGRGGRCVEAATP